METYDLSGFCTSVDHAVTFGKYVLSNRQKVDHTITFKTAPHYINGVQPGDYIRVFSTTQHVNRFNNGAILEDGSVVSKDAISGTKTFYWWNTSKSVVQEDTENFIETELIKDISIKLTNSNDQITVILGFMLDNTKIELLN